MGKKIETARLSAEAEALLEEARRNGASLAAFADREYGSLGTTTEEIFSQPDRKIMGALNYRIGRKPLERITKTERRLLAVYWLEREVFNGGFHQYFFNSAGNDSNAALAGLKEMGAHQAAAILERAMAVFPGGQPPTDRSERHRIMYKLGERGRAAWNECDEDFYKVCGPKENLSELTLSYARKNRAGIVLPRREANRFGLREVERAPAGMHAETQIIASSPLQETA